MKVLMETKHTIRIRKSLLPKDDATAEEFILEYFTGFRVNAQNDRDDWCVELTPEDFTYCEEFSPSTTLLKVPPSKYNSFQVFSQNQGLCLSDAWTPYAWSKHLNKICVPERLTIIHVDDHSDLMSPFIMQNDKQYFDMLTQREVTWSNPESVESAVRSGAITIGSMLTPIVMSAEQVNVIHLKQQSKTMTRCLIKDTVDDNVLFQGAKRLTINRDGTCCSSTQDCYIETSEYHLIHEHVLQNSTVILHIDMDYFNNRFNGSTSWRTDQISFDPDFATQKQEMEKLCSELSIVNNISPISCVYIGISPSFYPSEFWKEGLSFLLENLDKNHLNVDYLKSILDQQFSTGDHNEQAL